MHRSQGRDQISELDGLIEQGFVEEVLGLVRTGKEASVYCCRGGPAVRADLVAAKVYRGRQYRFKNDAVYQEARAREMGLRGRALRAMENKSRFGRTVQEGTWRSREYEVLRELYNAGADVPRPYAAIDGVILMEYLGDEDGAASQLNRLRLDNPEAPELFTRLIDTIELMLACNMVHGDFSPHNVLYWQGEMRVIDFPQVTDPRFNRSARELLSRDVENICRYFGQYGIEASSAGIVFEMWERWERGEL